MKKALIIVIMVVLVIVISMLYPAWWWIMLIPIVFGLFISSKVYHMFFMAFIAGFLAWGGQAFYLFNKESQIITERIAELFSIPSGVILLLVVAIIGGILSGTAAATGSSIRSLFVKSKRRINYY